MCSARCPHCTALNTTPSPRALSPPALPAQTNDGAAFVADQISFIAAHVDNEAAATVDRFRVHVRNDGIVRLVSAHRSDHPPFFGLLPPTQLAPSRNSLPTAPRSGINADLLDGCLLGPYQHCSVRMEGSQRSSIRGQVPDRVTRSEQ